MKSIRYIYLREVFFFQICFYFDSREAYFDIIYLTHNFVPSRKVNDLISSLVLPIYVWIILFTV